MSNEIQRVLLVGGPVDGTWRQVVPEHEAYILINYMPPPAVAYAGEPSQTQFEVKQYEYRRTGWNIQHEPGESAVYRFVYVHGLNARQLFERLLEHYGPTKDERIKQLEEQLRSAIGALQSANVMLGAHHKARFER